jgi:hypothetical protein
LPIFTVAVAVALAKDGIRSGALVDPAGPPDGAALGGGGVSDVPGGGSAPVVITRPLYQARSAGRDGR